MRGWRFRLGGIPVHVDPSFFVILGLLGLAGGTGGLHPVLRIALWLAAAFFAILAHELGHAVAFRRFGHTPEITLYGFGGLTGSRGGPAISHARQLAISLAGPAVGLVIGGAVLLAARSAADIPGGVVGLVVVRDLVFVNLVWAVFNLVPVLPLDGGRSLESVLNLVTRGRGERPALVVSVVVGGLGLAWALSTGQLWIALLAGYFTVTNVSALVGRGRSDEARQRLVSGADALQQGRAHEAAAMAESLLAETRDPAVVAAAVQLLASARLTEGRAGEAAAALERHPEDVPVPTPLRASVLHGLGRVDEALELLRQEAAVRPSAGARLAYAQGLLRAGRVEEAAAAAEQAPADPALAAALAQAFTDRDRPEEARRWAERA